MHKQLPNEHIKNYLQGRLSAPERAALEVLVASDPDLAQRVALLRAEMAAAELLIAEDTRQLFQTWGKQPRRTLLGKMPLLWSVGTIAVLLLLAIATWLTTRPTNTKTPPPPKANTQHPQAAPVPPPDRPRQPIAQVPPTTAPRHSATDYRALAAQNLYDPVLPNFRHAATDTADAPIAQAQQAFSAGNYEQTLRQLAQADSTHSQTTAFLAAHALFRLGRFGEAAEQFAALAAQRSRQYRYAAEWGLLLCRMAELPEQEAAFRQQLDALLAQPEHPYSEQAKALELGIRN